MDLTEVSQKGLLRCSRGQTPPEMLGRDRTLDQMQVGEACSVPKLLPVLSQLWPDKPSRVHHSGFKSGRGDSFD
jgi:hypothetical protein